MAQESTSWLTRSSPQRHFQGRGASPDPVPEAAVSEEARAAPARRCHSARTDEIPGPRASRAAARQMHRGVDVEIVSFATPFMFTLNLNAAAVDETAMV